MIFDGPDGGQLMSMDVRDPWRRVSVGTSGQSGESFSVQHSQCEKKQDVEMISFIFMSFLLMYIDLIDS